MTFREFVDWWQRNEGTAIVPLDKQPRASRQLFDQVSALALPSGTGVDEALGMSDQACGISIAEDLVEVGFKKWATCLGTAFEFDVVLVDAEPESEQSAGTAGPSKALLSSEAAKKRTEEEIREAEKKEAKETRLQLEELQIKTISGLVEPVEIDVNGKITQKRLLYLSELQASKFDMSSLQKVLIAMDVPTPKFVITIFSSSLNGKNGRSASHVSAKDSSVVSSHTHSEADEWELRESVRRMETFMEDVVLPIAVKTQAIVIAQNTNCHLCVAFSDACIKYSNAHGGQLPFTFIYFGQTSWVKHATNYEGTTAYKLKEASERPGGWQKRHAALQRIPGKEEARCTWGIEDLPTGCTHYVMTEGDINKLKAEFVQKLTDDLPSVALQTLYSSTPWTLDYVDRGLSVLVLDSRPPPGNGQYATDFAGMRDDMLALEKTLVGAGCQNNYNASTLAHLHTVLKNVLDRDERFAIASRSSGPDDSSAGSGARASTPESTSDIKQKFICDVIDNWERTERAQRHEPGDYRNGTATPTKSERASQGLRIVEAMDQLRRKVQASWLLKLLEREEKALRDVEEGESDQVAGIAGLNAWLLQFTITDRHDFGWMSSYTREGGWSGKLLEVHSVNNSNKVQQRPRPRPRPRPPRGRGGGLPRSLPPRPRPRAYS